MLTKIFKFIDKTLMYIEEWSLFAAVCVALLTAMANVILRKATNDLSLYWSDEVVRKVISIFQPISAVLPPFGAALSSASTLCPRCCRA